VGTVLPSNNRNPEYHSWNLSIQREIGWNSVLEINYTGSRGMHLFNPTTSMSNLDPRYWSMGRTALTSSVANPFYGQITDPKATNLNRSTIQLYRCCAHAQYDGTSEGTSEFPNADSSLSRDATEVGEAILLRPDCPGVITRGRSESTTRRTAREQGGWRQSSCRKLEPGPGASLSSQDTTQSGDHRLYELPLQAPQWGRMRTACGQGVRRMGGERHGDAVGGMPLQVTQSGGNIWAARSGEPGGRSSTTGRCRTG
jgi:hypothetical protein